MDVRNLRTFTANMVKIFYVCVFAIRDSDLQNIVIIILFSQPKHYNMMHGIGKGLLCYMPTAKAQVSMHICAV